MDKLIDEYPNDGNGSNFLREAIMISPFKGQALIRDLTMRLQFSLWPANLESLAQLKLALKHSWRYYTLHNRFLYSADDISPDLLERADKLCKSCIASTCGSVSDCGEILRGYATERRRSQFFEQYFQQGKDIRLELFSQLSDRMKLDMRWISLWNPDDLACMSVEMLNDLFNYCVFYHFSGRYLFPGLDEAVKDGWDAKTTAKLMLRDNTLLSQLQNLEETIPETNIPVAFPESFTRVYTSLAFLDQLKDVILPESKDTKFLDVLACLFLYSRLDLHEENLPDLVAASQFLLHNPTTRRAFLQRVGQPGVIRTDHTYWKVGRLITVFNRGVFKTKGKAREQPKRFTDATIFLQQMDPMTMVDMRWVSNWNPRKLEEMSTCCLRDLADYCLNFFDEYGSRMYPGYTNVNRLEWTEKHTAEVLALCPALRFLFVLPINNVESAESCNDYSTYPKEYRRSSRR